MRGTGTKAADGLRFRTRNYKHELRFDDSPRSVVNYTDEVWDTLCRQIAAHQFTGLVFYAGYHPFEHILDYHGFEDLATRPAAHRQRVRDRLASGLAIAHRHGLKTFIQHYVSHFPATLADKYHIAVRGRLADVDHPQIDRYARYCYRDIFRSLPDLDGLYFNFESAQSNWQHVLNTAIPEFSRMKKRPIMVYRLWDFTNVEGMRRLIKAYQGRVILGHKIMDTNDTYYLPVADSRVMEWKKRLGDVEWMFLVGPCHNCGTNLCNQLWGDYDFVWNLLADAEAKGADSFSFHTINEFFAPDLASTEKVFGEHERAMARFNRLHLEAVVDYVHNRRKTPTQRAATLARRVGCDPKAAKPLLNAVQSSSQPVLLAYQQFCYGSAAEGYLNRGRFSHIQDPFFYYPATELNHQSQRRAWNIERSESPWLVKTVDTTVAPDGFLQYIADYVDPSQPQATRHPKAIAATIRRDLARSRMALKQYRKRAGAAAADQLKPYIKQNEVVGEIVQRELQAAIPLYGIYFATSRGAAISALTKGLSELRQLQALIGRADPATIRVANRVFMFSNRGPDVTPEIDLVQRTLAHLKRANFPFTAYRFYLESRRLYNDLRRTIRPGRIYGLPDIAQAQAALELAMSKALESLGELRDPRHAGLTGNVRVWLDYLAAELARSQPPCALCPTVPTGQLLPLQHDHCFRSGESFAEDFLGFFEPSDYRRPAQLSFSVHRTDRELVLTLSERGIDMGQRLAYWQAMKDDSASISFISRIYLDAENQGRRADTYILWPRGEGVSLNKIPQVKAKTRFAHDSTSWQTTVWLPFALIGRSPKAGDVWGLNVTANPAVAANRQYSWSPQYDARNPRLFGQLQF